MFRVMEAMPSISRMKTCGLKSHQAQIDKHHESMDPQIKDLYHDCYWPLAGNFDPTTQDGSHPCIL